MRPEVNVKAKVTQNGMHHSAIPRDISTPNLGFLHQIIYYEICSRHDYSSNLVIGGKRHISIQRCIHTANLEFFPQIIYVICSWHDYSWNKIKVTKLIHDTLPSQDAITHQRGTCIKGLICPPMEPKTENCFSQIYFDSFFRRMTEV